MRILLSCELGKKEYIRLCKLRSAGTSLIHRMLSQSNTIRRFRFFKKNLSLFAILTIRVGLIGAWDVNEASCCAQLFHARPLAVDFNSGALCKEAYSYNVEVTSRSNMLHSILSTCHLVYGYYLIYLIIFLKLTMEE